MQNRTERQNPDDDQRVNQQFAERLAPMSPGVSKHNSYQGWACKGPGFENIAGKFGGKSAQNVQIPKLIDLRWNQKIERIGRVTGDAPTLARRPWINEHEVERRSYQ